MPSRASATIFKIVATLSVALAVGVGTYAVLRLEKMTELPGSYKLDLSDQFRVDPKLIHYRQTAEFPVAVDNPHALAIGADDRIYLAGRAAIRILTPDGQPSLEIAHAGKPPTCLAVAGADHSRPGQIYLGVANRICLLSPTGEPAGEWDQFDEKTLFTSLAIAGEQIFAADAGNRVVLQLDSRGQVQRKIGNARTGRNAPGFIIPSPYFDLVAGADGLVHVVNPGARRIETFAATGELETVWGKAGAEPAGFFGCCNPSHLARLADGRFVTSEKGVPRVKIYSSEGEFQSVVAGPEQLDIPPSALGDARGEADHGVFDVAADSRGRILVLDPLRNTIRVFVERSAQEKSDA